MLEQISMKAEFAQFITWCFYGIVGGGIWLGLLILKKMAESIADLNMKVALVIEKTSNHEKLITKALNKIEEQNDKIIILETNNKNKRG